MFATYPLVRKKSDLPLIKVLPVPKFRLKNHPILTSRKFLNILTCQNKQENFLVQIINKKRLFSPENCKIQNISYGFCHLSSAHKNPWRNRSYVLDFKYLIWEQNNFHWLIPVKFCWLLEDCLVIFCLLRFSLHFNRLSFNFI